MTQRTFNIIKACKCGWESYKETPLDRVKEYMSEECACPIEHYTDGIMDRIMFKAMCDYIDTCDKPSFFLKEINDIINKEKYSRAGLIALAFYLIRVKNDEGQYINGFTSEMWNE